MDNNEIISVIDGVTAENADVANALDKANDALAFSQSLWNLFKEQGFIALDDNEVDYALMENIIDGLNGELAAACLFLCEAPEVPKLMRDISDKLEKQSPDKAVPMVVAKGYKRIAARIENTKIEVEKAKLKLSAMRDVDKAD